MKINKLLILWLLVILNIIIIFAFSMQPGNDSLETSNKVVDIITKVEPIERLLANKQINILLIVRKAAHFSEYFILGILLNIAVYNTFKISRYKYLFVIIIGVIVALLDETIQFFNQGRDAKFLDVLIDSSGIFFSILIFKLFLVVKRKNNNKKIESA